MRPANIVVPSAIVQKWQDIVNLIAELVAVPAALIMEVEPPVIKVFLSSRSRGNPYHRDETADLNTGLYCETVMKTREPLLVPDALADEKWATNPDIKLGMISYLGFPIIWPNQEVFGTICVLDDKRNDYSALHQALLLQFRSTLEADLKSLYETDARLRRHRAYLTEAQRLSSTGSFGWNVQGGDIFWSEETFRIFGYEPGTTPSIEAALRRVHPEDRMLVQETIESAAREPRDFDFEHRLLMPDGTVKHLHVVAHAMTDEAGTAECVGAVMDITAARRAQQQLQEAQAELAHVTRVTTLGEITASIAHEVSQPLAAIGTDGEAGLRFLARDPPDYEEVRNALRRMIGGGERAARIVQHTRALIRKTKFEPVPIDLNTIVGDAVLLVQHEMASERVALHRDLAPELPCVLGDRIQLQQVMINLIVNGIQAMSAVSDRPRDLAIASRLGDAGQIVVSVRDSGVGIEPDDASRVFDAFFTTKPVGMGIGLSVCRSIIEAHGGRIWAANNSGPGATFQFSLPALRDDASDRIHTPADRRAAGE